MRTAILTAMRTRSAANRPAVFLLLVCLSSAWSSSQMSTTNRGCSSSNGRVTPWRSWPRHYDSFDGPSRDEYWLPGPFLAPSTGSARSSRQKSYCFLGSRPLQVQGLRTGQVESFEEGTCLSLSKDVAEKLRKTIPSPDAHNGSLGHIIRTIKHRQYEVCGRRQACVPAQRSAREHVTKEGALRYVQVQRCGCTPPAFDRTAVAKDSKKRRKRRCARSSSTQVFYQGTAFEARVDVGVCAGRCTQSESRCSPTKTTRKVVNGPNGPSTAEVITDCGCQKQCYRIPYFASAWKRNGKLLQPELIDVGECVGLCNNLRCRETRHPLMRGRCRFADELVEVACQPTSASTYNTLTNTGLRQTMSVINDCGCASK